MRYHPRPISICSFYAWHLYFSHIVPSEGVEPTLLWFWIRCLCQLDYEGISLTLIILLSWSACWASRPIYLSPMYAHGNMKSSTAGKVLSCNRVISSCNSYRRTAWPQWLSTRITATPIHRRYSSSIPFAELTGNFHRMPFHTTTNRVRLVLLYNLSILLLHVSVKVISNRIL